jgi:hypothetical protein
MANQNAAPLFAKSHANAVVYVQRILRNSRQQAVYESEKIWKCDGVAILMAI